jgi:hypothetical protein
MIAARGHKSRARRHEGLIRFYSRGGPLATADRLQQMRHQQLRAAQTRSRIGNPQR